MDSAMLVILEYNKVRKVLADSTGSAIGRELAEKLEPVNDYDEALARLEETREAADIMIAVDNVPLGGIRDIRAVIKRSGLGAMLEGHELLAVGSTLYAARRVKQFFTELDHNAKQLAAVVERITVLRGLETTIDNTISDQGTVKDSASPELARLRREIRTSQQKIKEKLESILHSAEYQKLFQDVLVTIRGDRYVIPVKQEYRHSFPGIVHDQSASGATVFIEPMAVVNLNNDLKQLIAAEENEVERVLRAVSSQVAAVSQVLFDTCLALGELDFAFAKARLALKFKASEPRLNIEGRVNIRQARHPLIPAEVVVPIDIRLGDDFTVLVITGPNTGGKTVTLKTVGLFAVMAQAGLFIPAAADSEIAVFRNVFADIGDEQSIEQSLSTFSAHMTNLVHILAKAGAGDIVLIDEIGAGTDPDEGAALAMALLEEFYSRGTRVIATTHYSELKTFAYTRHGIENASVEFDSQTLKPTYRLLIGAPGSSKAFHISRRLGLSEDIINRARELVDEDYAEFNQVLSALETQKRLYSERQSEMIVLRKEVEELRQRMADEHQAMIGKKHHIIAKAQEEAAQVLRLAKREAEEVIVELKAQFAVANTRERQQTIENSRGRIRDGMARVRKNLPDEPVYGEAVAATGLRPGTAVYVTTLQQKGIVLVVNGDEVTVQLGIMKMNVPLSACRSVEEKNAVKARSSSASGAVSMTKVQNISREVDLRGMNVEEAENILDKFIDDAVLAGLSEAIIIHGKGTGALRKGVRDYLKAHPSVKEARIGELSEGGTGVTVIKLV
ncbi:MAG: mutS2 1 [Firmicutes bacterium]|nr:mutS2 1 [Bacillota bacterium]